MSSWYNWTAGSWASIGYVVVSAALIYVSTVLAVRAFGERRTLTEMTIFDFAVAVALGAIIARTATTRSPSFAQGLAAVVALLVTHNLISAVRLRFPGTRRVFGRDPVVLVWEGKVQADSLEDAHMTLDDLLAVLRERGVASVDDVKIAVLESRGSFSVLRADTRDQRLWPWPPGREAG